MKTIYVESNLIEHPRVKKILSRHKKKVVIECNHYGEVFNRKNQNFRQQKSNPALILAEKKGRKVIPSPAGFGIGGKQNYYFSHMLNCPFDCRYCFLQGLYQSAHHVVFVNYEDFMTEIKDTTDQSSETCYFFSGYDADSLAYEPVTHFAREFVPFFSTLDNAYLELRTKSANIRELINQPASSNIIVAFSLNPETVCQQHEEKTASLDKRIGAINKISQHGYSIGLRLDPIIYCDNFKSTYEHFIEQLAKRLNHSMIHSISIGGLRFPAKMHKKIIKLYPNDKLLNQVTPNNQNQVCYAPEVENEMLEWVQGLVAERFSTVAQFTCTAEQ
jgi:spore photoproduct lyase